MTDEVQPTRDLERQRPIPSVWREKISEIADAIADEDYRLSKLRGVRPIDDKRANAIKGNIAAYGAKLRPLPDDTWYTSVCHWMNGYWDALIDLFTAEEGASDLVLSLRVYEVDGKYDFEVRSVHVP